MLEALEAPWYEGKTIHSSPSAVNLGDNIHKRQLALFEHQIGISLIGVNPYYWCDCATSQELTRRLCQQLNGMNLSKKVKKSKAIALEAIVKDALPENAHWSVVLRVKKVLRIA